MSGQSLPVVSDPKSQVEVRKAIFDLQAQIKKATASSTTYFLGRKNVAQAMVANVTKMTFSTVEYDTGGLWDSANSWFNIEETGLYIICVTPFNANVATYLRAYNFDTDLDFVIAVSPSGTPESASVICPFIAGQRINFRVSANATVDFVTAQNGTFTLMKIGSL